MGPRKFWLDSQGLGKMGNGLLDLSLAAKSNSKVVVCLRIVWLDSQGLGKMGNGLLGLSLATKSNSKVVVCLRIVRLDSSGPRQNGQWPPGSFPACQKQLQGCNVL